MPHDRVDGAVQSTGAVFPGSSAKHDQVRGGRVCGVCQDRGCITLIHEDLCVDAQLFQKLPQSRIEAGQSAFIPLRREPLGDIAWRFGR